VKELYDKTMIKHQKEMAEKALLGNKRGLTEVNEFEFQTDKRAKFNN